MYFNLVLRNPLAQDSSTAMPKLPHLCYVQSLGTAAITKLQRVEEVVAKGQAGLAIKEENDEVMSLEVDSSRPRTI